MIDMRLKHPFLKMAVHAAGMQRRYKVTAITSES